MMPVLIGVFYHSQPLRKASKSEADASYEHKHISIPHSLEKLQVSSVGIGDKKKRNYPPSTGMGLQIGYGSYGIVTCIAH
jgi:hypothetical protein